MKKIVFTFSFLLVSLTIVSAQLKLPFYIEPKIGANVMPYADNSFEGRTYKMGLNGGVDAEYPINNWLSVKLGINYSSKKKGYNYLEKTSFIKTLTSSFGGNSLAGTIGNIPYINDTVYSTTKGSVNLSYLEVPLMASVNYKGLSLSAGAFVAFLLKANSHEEMTQNIPALQTFGPLFDTIPFASFLLDGVFPGYNNPVVKDNTDKSIYRSVDHGFVIDLTYTTEKNISFGVRYSQGLKNYRKTPLISPDVNRVWMVTIGYHFGGAIKGKGNNSMPKAIYDLNKDTIEKK